MRIRELILEYNAEITLKKQGDKLGTVASRFNMTPELLLKDLEEIDPTKNKQYVMWLIREIFKEKFKPKDSPRIRQTLIDFEKLKPRLAKKDVNSYDLHELEKTIDDILEPELGRDDTVLGHSFPVVDDSRVLYNGPLGQLAIPETKEASCELGKGTRWCTAASNRNYFDSYDAEGNLYVWRDRNGEKYQFHFELMHMTDATDQELSLKEIKYFRLEHPVLKKLFQSKEKDILKTPDNIINYAMRVIQGPWPEAEEIISDDPELAIDYARSVLRKRWRKVEEKILTGPSWAFKYARDVIKGPWPEAEHLFIDDPYWASRYAILILGKRWPEAEKTIKKDPDEFQKYSKHLIRRLP